MAQLFLNNARCVLAKSASAAEDLLHVKNAVNIPSSLDDGDYILLTLFRDTSRYGDNIEVVKVTYISDGETPGELKLSVERGYEFEPKIHLAGERAESRLTAKSCNEIIRQSRELDFYKVKSQILNEAGNYKTLDDNWDPNDALAGDFGLWADTPNSPWFIADTFATYKTERLFQGSNNRLIQKAYSYNAANPSIGFRVKRGWADDYEWLPWEKMITSRNAMDPVAFRDEDGNARGGLMEHGENANGSYWKYANGLMICVGRFSFELRLSGREQVIRYPAAFKTNAQVSLSSTQYSAVYEKNRAKISLGVTYSHSGFFRAVNTVPYDSECTYIFTAIGGWN